MGYKIYFFVFLIFVGCAGNETIIYRDVYIPQRCNASVPDKPVLQTNPVLTNIMILEYAEKLKETLQYCIGEEVK